MFLLGIIVVLFFGTADIFLQPFGNIEEELGDLLFSVVNVARFMGVDPEVALGKACDKFTNRFAYVESAAAQQGKILADMTLDEMEALYQEGKSRE